MKVIHLITTIDLGGAERQLVILSRHQINLGLEVEVIFLKGNGILEKLFVKNGIRVNKRIRNKNIMYQIIFLFFYLNRNFQIVHAHLSRSELIASLTTFIPKLIVTKHNSERLYPNGSKFLSKALAIIISFRADRIITISKAVKNYLFEIGELKFESKTFVVHYGFDDKIRNIPKIKKSFKSLKFATVCRLEKQKDVKTILYAWEKFHYLNKSDELYIVGSGTQELELKLICKELKLRKVFWVKSRIDVASIYRKMDVFIFSTLYEGFGLVLLEAMKFKIPILASNNTSIPEVVGKKYPGLFETSNPISLCQKMEKLHDKNFYENLTFLGQTRINKFDPEKMAIKIKRIYTDN